MTETKIKVDKTKLIEAIRARRTEAEAAHQEECRKYPTDLGKWRSEAMTELERLTVCVERGEFLDFKHSITRPPQKPSDFKSTSYDRHIAMLEMSPDDVVTVNTTDFGRYLQ